MNLKISGLNELREHLERLRPEEVMARALAEQAARMAERVREGLSEQPGAAGHDEPWLRSGALRDSVGAEADGLQAMVGSSDPAAGPQEMGTAHMPARPFLAPVAAGMGEEVARVVGAQMAAALRGEEPVAAEGAPADSEIVQVSADGIDLPRAAGAALVLGAIALYLRQQQEEAARRAMPGPAATPVPEMPNVVEAAVPPPPPKEGETPLDVLKPGGQNVGELGENSGVRVLPGGGDETRELFDRLTKGGTDITRPGHIGKVIRLPDGSVISYRPRSKSGPPIIDVNVPGFKIRKLEFPGESG